MGQNFITADREQVLLMPPALVDWLPDAHFVWTVLGAVEQMDLAAFYDAYRANGQGRAAYDPQVMLSLLLYAYATGISSSRQIERCCEVDVAFKVITAMRVPDHSTIAEFRRRHQDANRASPTPSRSKVTVDPPRPPNFARQPRRQARLRIGRLRAIAFVCSPKPKLASAWP
jgi:transposase